MNRIAHLIRCVSGKTTIPARVAGVVEDAAELIWSMARAILTAAAVLGALLLPAIVEYILNIFNL